MAFNTLRKRWKLLAVSVLMVSIPAAFLGYVNDKVARTSTRIQVEGNLKKQALLAGQAAARAHAQITEVNRLNRERANSIVIEEAQAVYALAKPYTDKELLKDSLAEIVVGKTGYPWVMGYDGTLILSKKRQIDGVNIWKAKDSTGWLHVQSVVKESKKLRGGETYIHVYSWQNPDDKTTRDKVAATIHFPKWKWIIGISTYYDELYDADYEERVLRSVKGQLSEIVVGKTGYVFALGCKGKDKGHYIISENRRSDGENAMNLRDSDGHLVTQNIVAKALGLKKNEASVIYSSWKTPQSDKPQLKLSAFTYIPEMDWLVGTTAYLDDFLYDLEQLRNQTIWIVLLSIFIGSAVVYFTAEDIIESVKSSGSTRRKILGTR
ncbi:MAG: Cache 3/Cache 2 fusion domain-containing protein [Desulfobacteraceae bacterium]|nr:Cache 3/Cache 2 fusion domain-containing protein [Desulfobacteraceae bacterium]